MARTHFFCGIALCVALLWPGVVAAGDVFTGYQIDNQREYYTYLGVRTPLTSSESNLQPFIQVMGAGLGYTFKDNGANRNAEVQFATPSLGLKYIQGPWNFIGFAGPQFRWKQQDRPTGGRTNESDVGIYLQGEAFYCMSKERFMPLRHTRIWIVSSGAASEQPGWYTRANKAAVPPTLVGTSQAWGTRISMRSKPARWFKCQSIAFT